MTTKTIFCSSPIFAEIYEKIKQSYPNCCLLYVEEISNERLEAAYQEKKNDIKRKRGTVSEARMFHGTSEKAKISIIRNGFDPEMNRVSAYGKGTYFHIQANYSKEYAIPGTNEVSYIFLCDVLVGNTKVGSKNEIIDTMEYDNLTNRDKSIIVTPYVNGAIPRYCAAFYRNAK